MARINKIRLTLPSPINEFHEEEQYYKAQTEPLTTRV